MSPVRLGPVTSTNEGGTASAPDPRVREHVARGSTNRLFTLHDTEVDAGQQRGDPPAGAPGCRATTDPVAATAATAPGDAEVGRGGGVDASAARRADAARRQARADRLGDGLARR